ncbi:hypothetical protein D8Y22_20450 [Salinadaptatus halalkaliphilus]|uniref:Uncharacterized protein n=1 Tax=Salinadaptatus halalkaliphilus TaxID=2419781 RepID=A0A4S3TFZ0_9EURY|nr:hypothetical protein [Salinadaptatus halalkaliphilus]THE62834.1 hypothetical protein D8Y22_20450 [Salinadaptatus halalkaliphilus]
MWGTDRFGRDETDRGQAYSLEGFAAAAVVLFALLFAMQSVVITPGTGGAVDRTSQAQIQQETQDALVVAAHSNESDRGNLSVLVHDWADGDIEESMDIDDFEDEYTLGYILETHVAAPSYPNGYEVEFTYLNSSADGDVTTSDQNRSIGSNITDQSAVTASYTIPLFDETEHVPEYDGSSESIHNIVEVRVTVW